MRLSADVSWSPHGVPGKDRIMGFEAMADEVVHNFVMPLLALCQYRLGELNPKNFLEILERHPSRSSVVAFA